MDRRNKDHSIMPFFKRTKKVNITVGLLNTKLTWKSFLYSVRTAQWTHAISDIKTNRLISFVIKPSRCTNFTNSFFHETLHVSDSSSVHHQEFIRCTLSIGICHTAVWHIPLLGVQWINSWWWTDELSETCTVSWQNKFVKLVHLLGFIIKKFVTMHGHRNVQ